MTETTAGHRFSEGRARFNRVANVLLLLCGLNASAYFYFLNDTHGRVTAALGVLALALKSLVILINARLPASKPPDPLDELGPIRIASDGVAHVGGVHWPVVLPRSQVERLELVCAPGADKPVAVGVSGVVLILLGLPLAVMLAPKIGVDRSILAAFCLFAGLAATGIWMLWFAMRKRYVLVAHTPNGSSRMVFHRSARREDVIHFATSAARRHDYPFDFGQGLVG